MNETLDISESFYSIQCEGATTGYPAYFIRLKGCNLSCGLSTKHILDIKNAGKDNTPSGDFIGDLHKEGSATWTCDTAPVWLFGQKTQFSSLIDKWKEEQCYDNIMKGVIHLIWTGGEPTIPKHQKNISSFLDYCNTQENNIIYNEIETNGTFYIEDSLFSHLDQINCSVKLSNSGMSKDKRIVTSALSRIIDHPNYWFKFVVSSEDDMNEIFNDFINPLSIDLKRVILMPGLDSQDNFHERTRFILELAKKYGVIGLTRLHVSAWDKTTGV